MLFCCSQCSESNGISGIDICETSWIITTYELRNNQVFLSVNCSVHQNAPWTLFFRGCLNFEQRSRGSWLTCSLNIVQSRLNWTLSLVFTFKLCLLSENIVHHCWPFSTNLLVYILYAVTLTNFLYVTFSQLHLNCTWLLATDDGIVPSSITSNIVPGVVPPNHHILQTGNCYTTGFSCPQALAWWLEVTTLPENLIVKKCDIDARVVSLICAFFSPGPALWLAALSSSVSWML